MIFLFMKIPSMAMIFDISSLMNSSYQGKEINGVTLSIIGMVIVFFSLLLLSFFVAGLSSVLNRRRKKKLVEEGKISAETDHSQISTTGEVNAAISMALSLYFGEIHDLESGVLTIDKVRRPYQPWSSKLYNLTQTPVKQNSRR